MRSLLELDGHRDAEWELNGFGAIGDAYGGCFRLQSPMDKRSLRIIASNGAGWDHVSVSRSDRCPAWEEMEAVKRLFFRDYETAMQLHVPPSEHVNNHPNCLHLWRPHAGGIPFPPSSMVGLKALTPDAARKLMGVA